MSADSKTFAERTHFDIKPTSESKSTLDEVLAAAKRSVAVVENDVLVSWRDNTQKLNAIESDLAVIRNFLKTDACTIADLTAILEIFSKNILKEYYDYAWRHVERHQLFIKLIESMAERLEILCAKSNGTIKSVFNSIYYLSFWNLKFTPHFLNNLINKMQSLLLIDYDYSAQDALHLLTGLCRLNYQPENNKQEWKTKKKFSSTELFSLELTATTSQEIFFSTIAEAALALLLKRDITTIEGAPFQPYLYRDENLTFQGKPVAEGILPESAVFITYAKKHPETGFSCMHSNLALMRQNYVFRLLGSLLTSDLKDYNDLSVLKMFENINRSCPAFDKKRQAELRQVQNKHNIKLLQALDPSVMTVTRSETPVEEPSATEIAADLETKKRDEIARNLPKVFYFETETFRKHLFWLLSDVQSYKGFIWYLKVYSKQLADNAKFNSDGSHKISYSPVLIDRFLKLVRNEACDIQNDPEIIQAFAVLFKEAIAPYNIELFKADPSLLLNILWMNMYLSTTLNPSLAYNKQEQSKIFNIVKVIKPDLSQARFLFEIQTMAWHGGVPFPENLQTAMLARYKSFSQFSNPSTDENTWFEKITNRLPTTIAKDLQQGYICPISGMEIDIVYLPGKVAIHIDGWPHFNQNTGSKTLKTLFRNLCLNKADWNSTDVKLGLPEEDANRLLDDIVQKIQQAAAAMQANADATSKPKELINAFVASKQNACPVSTSYNDKADGKKSSCSVRANS